MKNYSETKQLVKDLNAVNDNLFKANQISEEEYYRNIKILYNAICGNFNLSLDQIITIGAAVKKNIYLAKLRLCISILEINFN